MTAYLRVYVEYGFVGWIEAIAVGHAGLFFTQAKQNQNLRSLISEMADLEIPGLWC